MAPTNSLERALLLLDGSPGAVIWREPRTLIALVTAAAKDSPLGQCMTFSIVTGTSSVPEACASTVETPGFGQAARYIGFRMGGIADGMRRPARERHDGPEGPLARLATRRVK
jgi:hypothetical protein